jgi:hypothetical protein
VGVGRNTSQLINRDRGFGIITEGNGEELTTNKSKLNIEGPAEI